MKEKISTPHCVSYSCNKQIYINGIRTSPNFGCARKPLTTWFADTCCRPLKRKFRKCPWISGVLRFTERSRGRLHIYFYHRITKFKQEAHGPRVAHLSDIATADMQMLCNIFPILSSQLMKRSSFKQFFILKKNIYGMPVN